MSLLTKYREEEKEREREKFMFVSPTHMAKYVCVNARRVTWREGKHVANKKVIVASTRFFFLLLKHAFAFKSSLHSSRKKGETACVFITFSGFSFVFNNSFFLRRSPPFPKQHIYKISARRIHDGFGAA